MNMPSTAALTIEDRISDPMMPELDPSLLDFGRMDVDFNTTKDDPLNWNSQILSDPTSIEIGRHAPVRDARAEFDEEDMNIDINLTAFDDDLPLDLGPKPQPTRDLEDELNAANERLPEELDFQDQTRLSSPPSLIADDGGKEPEDRMLLDDGNTFQLPMDDGLAAPTVRDSRLERDSQSPLSSLDEQEEEPMRQAPHKAKKRKILQADSDTMLSSAQIKQQQADRTAILRPTSFLSRDPMIFHLMNLQKNGGFVSSVMGKDRGIGWAPEIRDILSIESVRKSGELKRKRDSGVADVSENEPQGDGEGMPQLEIPDETFGALDQADDIRRDATRDRSVIDLPADDGFLAPNDEAGLEGYPGEGDSRDQFDETTAPLLHPSEQGAISQGTKHAVHLLRDRFGSAPDGSPSQQKRNNILFQDLLPERKASKADATKMFFEVLVLATKDAVKVEQGDKEIGSAIRVRAKRGLWGSWAETEAGGEIAEQEDTDAPAAAAAVS